MSKQLLAPEIEPKPSRRLLIVSIAVLGVVALVVGFVAFGGGPALRSAAQAGPVVPPTSDAKPYAQAFAKDLQGQVREPLPTPVPFSYGETVDGCDRGYGVRGECVPFNFPPQVAKTPAAKCAYLKSHKFRALEVTGKDRHQLAPAGGPKAPSGNPYACPGVLPV